MFKGTSVHVTKSIGPSSYGVGQVAVHLVKAQLNSGFDSVLWTLDPPQIAAQAAATVDLPFEAVSTFEKSWPEFLCFGRTMEARARQMGMRVDGGLVVHQHMIWLLYSRTPMILREAGAKLVIAPHGALDDWALAKSSWKKKIADLAWEGKNLNNADCLQATSEREVTNFRDYGLRNPIARINNGVTQEALEAVGRGEDFLGRYGITKDRRLMLFIARISRQKGLPMMLEAMRHLRHRLGEWALVVAGSDQDGHEAEVKKLVTEYGLTDHVIFVGPLFNQAKIDAFAASQAFVLPSHCEGSPMIVLEAMAGRLPVLCTQAASWAELETNKCGWWPKITMEAVRDALEDLLSKNKLQLEEMGNRAHALVGREYTWKMAADRSAALYAWLTASGDEPDFIIRNR